MEALSRFQRVRAFWLGGLKSLWSFKSSGLPPVWLTTSGMAHDFWQESSGGLNEVRQNANGKGQGVSENPCPYQHFGAIMRTKNANKCERGGGACV